MSMTTRLARFTQKARAEPREWVIYAAKDLRVGLFTSNGRVLTARTIFPSLSRSQSLSLVIMLFTGLGFMVNMAASNTVIQTLVHDEMRGRVMALFGVAFLGMTPFGSLLAGAVASRIGAPETVIGCGMVCLFGAAVFCRKLPALRRQLHSPTMRLQARLEYERKSCAIW
jgi:MFS family permease